MEPGLPETIFWVLIATVVYVYFGYPVVLLLIARQYPQHEVLVPENWPTVTLVISAYNEAAVISQKLQNALATDYDHGLLEIIVVSDASDDGTDEVVRSFSDQGVALLHMTKRSGKTVGLNEAAKVARGEIIIFSDANAMYAPGAIRALVRHFQDAAIGAAVGESTYENGENDAERSEGLYWKYETWLKVQESRTGSVVGGDGAIYAIRRELYQPMRADALSDFVNPLQVVRSGFRCIYEPAAISVEKSAGNFSREYRRKVRIVNRAWRAMLSLREMLNPLTHGWFAIQLISHKVLRWWVPVLMVAVLILNMLLAGRFIYDVLLVGQLTFYVLAAIGWAMRNRASSPACFYVPYYFCLVNAASLKGLIDVFRGETYTTWATVRSPSDAASPTR